MAVSRISRLGGYALGCAALMFAAQSLAASGFIASMHVSEGNVYSELSIRFNCEVQYIDHDPPGQSDMIRVHIEPTAICFGVPPSVADSREMHRPVGSDNVGLLHVEYDGAVSGSPLIRLGFEKPVTILAPQRGTTNELTFRILAAQENTRAARTPEAASPARRVARSAPPATRFVINLESSLRYPATGDIPVMDLAPDQKLFVSEALIDGKTWYRLRVGYFSSMEDASRVLREIRDDYPSAWIDRMTAASESAPDVTLQAPVAATIAAEAPEPGIEAVALPAVTATDGIEGLMLEARRAMMAGELSRAIQIYTKVLQQPHSQYHRDAQEYLALARERNGQVAHAKAEYERYLAIYPDDEHAERVQQRLAALLAGPDAAPADTAGGSTSADGRIARENPWKIRSFLAQHYRRDVNQVNELEEVTSQSSLYTDVTIDARRRGERFDFSTRLTAGYRYDMLGEDRVSSGNDFRLSYFYADLLDTRTRLRGRLGRQTRNTGGVLGRFDGLNLTYELTQRVRFETVAGQPVYSTSTADEQSRSFYGLSSNFAPFGENLELGAFFLQQAIEGLTDRQVVGTELRYFGEASSLWGSVDYDLEFGELGSAFLQGSWRLPGRFTVSGSLDRRRSPFLSLGNVLIGQLDQDFALLAATFPEDELRNVALQRSALTSSASLGLSRPLTPRLQLSLSANRSIVDAIPAWGDAPATPETEYSYYSADLVASSLFKEGDVGILSMRYSASDSANVYSISLDSRFPFGQAWRVNPRLRVDYRDIISDGSTQLIYTPGLRLQYRLGRRGRMELEAGKQFSTREMAAADLDRESYFINLGYQLFY